MRRCSLHCAWFSKGFPRTGNMWLMEPHLGTRMDVSLLALQSQPVVAYRGPCAVYDFELVKQTPVHVF